MRRNDKAASVNVSRKDKPWEALKVSRATWYRMREVCHEHGIKLPMTPNPKRHMTQAERAADYRISVRSVRRFDAQIKLARRIAPDLCKKIRNGKLNAREVEQIVHLRTTLAMDVIPGVLKLFEEERRSDISAQAIVAHLNDPMFTVEIVVIALDRLNERGQASG